MRVYYPEDGNLDDRKPLVASMTVHMESDVERYLIDNSPETLELFGKPKTGAGSYVVVQDESLILPPAEFWMWEDHDDYGPNKLKSLYDYDPADDQPDE